MRTLVRMNPVSEFAKMNRMMDRLFDDFSGGFHAPNRQSWLMPLDVAENDDGYEVVASLPGVNADDINVTFENKRLTIEAELKRDETIEEGNYRLQERQVGSFKRSLRLPAMVNADAISADYHNGVLTLTLPKAEEIKPKRISIKANGASPQAIEEG